MRVHDWFEYHATTRPKIEFLRQDGVSLTYEAAEHYANRWAQAMIARGLKVGDRIGWLSTNAIDMGVMYMACSKAGIAPVMLNYRLAPREMQWILEDAEPALVFARGDQYVGLLDGIRANLPGVKDWISVAAGAPKGWTPMEDFLREGRDERPKVGVSPDDILYLMYTSGTTGHPKGVMVSHRNAITHVEQSMVASSASRAPGQRALMTTPLYHAAGALRVMTAAINGGTLVLMEHFDAKPFVKNLVDERINTVNMVPSIIQRLLDEIPGIETMDFRHLEVIYYGAAPIAEPTLRRAMEVFHCDLIQGYGLTESTGGFAYLNEFDHQKALEGRPELLRSTGRTVVLAEVKIADPEGREVPRGTAGEICVRGANVMKGYWRNPKATAEAIRDGWLHTGDAGTMDAEGYLYLHDRLKDMIVSGGTNIYPAEIESVLLEHPAIADAAVVGIPDEKWGEVPLAVCVARGEAPTGEAMIAFCRERLGGYKVPRRYEFVKELPRNASGKLLKRVLREPYWKGVARKI